MSRRDPRVSLNNRQNDALTEFENCNAGVLTLVAVKKKFLLANKHITKLNSTLSVRIEELQAEISTLYVENLRLRTSEIALAAQLKKEQDKSRKILVEAEAATSNLSKHLAFLRQSLNIPAISAFPNVEPKPPPKARRPVLDPNASPQMPRLSRAPNIPGIYEDEEVASSPEADEHDPAHTSSFVPRKAKERLSASRLPLPSRVPSPPPLPAPLHVNLAEPESSTKRKTGRRQSGLLSVNTDVGTSVGSGRGGGRMPPRAASPAFGSPVRRDAGIAEDEEERQVDEMLGSRAGPTEELDSVTRSRKEKKEKKVKHAEREIIIEDSEAGSSRVRERKKRKEDDYSGLKDVTNSPRSRALLPPLDTNTSDRDRSGTPETDGPTSAATSLATSRTFLSTPATTPATTPQVTQLPTPRASSPIPPGATSASESDAPTGARERRVRKSINYAEPKLNTKMRKPDPEPAPLVTTAPKKRPSGITIESDDAEPRSSLDGPSRREIPSIQPFAPRPSTSTSSSSSTAGTSVKRKKSRPRVSIEDDDESDGTQADAEYVMNGWVNSDTRRRSGQSGATRGSNSLRRVLEEDDARRHSFAV
ncbi:hypothetical protein BU15DRAFT_88122 [Melanogaster broomeanus]|nr:hypothetical protein BU15DRAFT_88122 [Melanogaster broomeanus]